jgi:plasmid maintenance system killer protein
MKALLGEERYSKSQGTDASTAAANLRQDLAKANPNDAQFQELLTAQQQWNERRSELDKQFQDDPSSAVYAEQLKALETARDQEYQRVLGTNIFDALQKEQDGGYSKMKRYENIWELDDTRIDYVYGAMKYYEKSVQDYQAQARALEAQGQSVDWDAVNRNLKQFAEQTRQQLQNYLGQDRFNKMQRNGVFQFNPSPQRGPSQ